MARYVIGFEDLRRADVALVGGKNSSLGEMVQELAGQGIAVPGGFATTADAYRAFLSANGLEAMIADTVGRWQTGKITLAKAGSSIRAAIVSGDWPEEIRADILSSYAALSETAGKADVAVAVRSSATAEDLPDASFAGQQETFLNIEGEADLLTACRRCFASLFTDRAISYREVKGFDHMAVALSVGVQRMVRADTGGSGVMFSIDTESGFDKIVLINAAWGLGENVVQGAVDPDEYQVFKPFLDNADLTPVVGKRRGAKEIKMILGGAGPAPVRNVPTSKAERAAWVLSDGEILSLARMAATIERHYGCAMDMEWARDGDTGELFIVQARPETVESQRKAGALRSYSLDGAGEVLLQGLSVGNAVATGRICLIESVADIDRFVDGSILVTSNTDPDWVPVMKRAAAIITDHGGRTSHAAIVSRELGVPAIVGTGNATHVLHDQQDVTVNCAAGEDGLIHAGIAKVTVEELDLSDLPETRTRIMLNMANPSAAFRWWRLPVDGVGLARMEFVVNNAVKVHPMALIEFDKVTDADERAEIETLTAGYPDKPEYFVDQLARGLSQIAAFAYPNPVIVRMSDFKSNEYADLIGGRAFEPVEHNPMLGFRGASRYYSDKYREGFALECEALKRARERMGMTNLIPMIPFCRTPGEADKVLDEMAGHGLVRGEDGLQVFVMVEVPSNVILADEFAKRFDGFSIGSNDLTQLVLGIDRDSGDLAHLFDARDEAVKTMIRQVIEVANRTGTKIGICGQAPSDHPEFAEFLVECGIDTIAVNPDSLVAVRRHVAHAEQRIGK